MIPTVLAALSRLAGLVLVMTVADQLVALLPADPASTLRALCVGLMLCVVAAAVLRLARTRHEVIGSSRPAVATLAIASVPEETVKQEFQLDRRARHEAAHAVLALHFHKPSVRADVIRTHRYGGSVSYGDVFGSLADESFKDMHISFGGQIVDVDGGYFDYGSQEDMQNVTMKALNILSTGQRPEGFTGRVTVERLILAARSNAVAILASKKDAVDRITTALVEKRRLSHDELVELVELMTPAAAAEGSRS